MTPSLTQQSQYLHVWPHTQDDVLNTATIGSDGPATASLNS